jgi:NADPH:quinone reductase-like Zn-dependent oxidoreductase
MTGSTMKGARIHEHGGLEKIVVESMPVPEPGPGEVRVRLRAAALNHLDLFVLGGIPGIDMPLPHVLGADGAGVVDALGDQVEGWSEGDEVVLNPGLWCQQCESCVGGEQSMCATYQLLGEHVDGTLAEAIVVPAVNLHRKPANLGWHEAAAFPLVTLTAWRMLVTRAGVGPGQTVLIHGVGGGVSLTALQIAKSAGATVYVTSHSEAKLERARELGAAAAWNYGEVNVTRAVREITDRRGVDIVVDNVGAATFATSVEAVRRGGAIVTCGVTTGPKLPIDGRRVFWKHIDIMGSTMGNESDFRAMLRAVSSGRVEPVVDRVFPLDETAAAMQRLKDAEQFGKVVLDIATS